jgi:DNA replication protein DnaC
MLEGLAREAGDLSRCRFETFNPARAISDTITWRGETYSTQEQSATLRAAYDALIGYNQPGEWFFLSGPVGSGKSHLAAAVANRFVAEGCQVGYASVPELLSWIRSGIEDGTSHDRLRMLCKVDFLVLDDYGTEKASAWVEETLFVLVNYRYLHADKTTFITSNLKLGELSERISSRIWGRSGGETWVIAEDYRKLRRKKTQ